MENLVVSLETAKKLKAAGFPQGHYVWRLPMAFGDGMAFVEHSINKREASEGMASYPAPTAQEIADQLPDEQNGNYLHVNKFGNIWFASYYEVHADICHLEQAGSTMAEALALLYLKLNA